MGLRVQGLGLRGFVLKAFEDPGFRVPEGLALKFDASGRVGLGSPFKIRTAMLLKMIEK